MNFFSPIRFALPLLCAVLVSCNDKAIPVPGDETILIAGDATSDSFEESRDRWEAKNYENYSFEFRGGPEQLTPIRPYPSILIRVVNNKVLSATEIASGNPAEPLWEDEPTGYKTIDGLFEWIASRIQDPDAYLIATYDAVSGFPITAHSMKKGFVNGGLVFSIQKITVK